MEKLEYKDINSRIKELNKIEKILYKLKISDFTTEDLMELILENRKKINEIIDILDADLPTLRKPSVSSSPQKEVRT